MNYLTNEMADRLAEEAEKSVFAKLFGEIMELYKLIKVPDHKLGTPNTISLEDLNRNL